MPIDHALVGAAGEHYVAFQLSARGYPVGFTPRGTRAADLLVTNLDTDKSITVQVKTMADAFVQSRKWGAHWNWRVGIKRGTPRATFLYCFVDLGQRGPNGITPQVFVVPSERLQPLLEAYPRSPSPPRDVWCVIEESVKADYLGRWDLIDSVLT